MMWKVGVFGGTIAVDPNLRVVADGLGGMNNVRGLVSCVGTVTA